MNCIEPNRAGKPLDKQIYKYKDFGCWIHICFSYKLSSITLGLFVLWTIVLIN